MKQSYQDITSRVPDPPLWHDEHGVPRYAPFTPALVSNIYASEAALVQIACQACQQSFLVAFAADRGLAEQFGSLADRVRRRQLFYGDPPNAGCCPAGPTMTSDPIRVHEYWRRADTGWVRDPTLELSLDDSSAA